MIITELSRFLTLNNLSPYSAFVYKATPTVYEYPSFWTDVFGFPGDSSNERIFIKSIKRLYINRYSSVSSIETCITTEKSFYFDFENQAIYVHVEHDQANYLASDVYQYGRVYGYSDKEFIYIDDIEYLPLLKDVPSIAQQEDLQNYDKLSLITGSSTFDNTGGEFDIFINEDIYGNDIDYYYLDDNNLSEFTRSDLVSLTSLFVNDFDFSLNDFQVFIQDKRASQNVDIPSYVFSSTEYPNIDNDLIGEPVPLIYGSPRISKAYPTNSNESGNIVYRQSVLLTSLGTVQIKSGDSWNNVTPLSIDLSRGEFELNFFDCRSEGSQTGDVLECRVLNSTGISITYSSDIIKDLNLRELSIPYDADNYNITEWESEQSGLDPISIVFDKPVKLFDAIRLIQNGSNQAFRYEISNGLRTIRLYDESRAPAGHIFNSDIFNINELKVQSNKDLICGIVKVNYNKDFYSGSFLKYLYDEGKNIVLEKYAQSPTLEVNTYLDSSAKAKSRAEFDFARFSEAPRVADLNIKGKEFLNLRIYDIMTVELTPGFCDLDSNSIQGREYFGFWKGIIVSIDPDFNEIGNNIGLLLVSKYTPS